MIIEERRQRIELSPINLLNEQMAAALHPNHPYRIPVLGWAHEMSRLKREDAMAFYARHYAPNNAVLVIQGDVEPEDPSYLREQPMAASLAGRHRKGEPGQAIPKRGRFAASN